MYKDLHEYKQVSAGMSHTTRCTLVVDVDKEIDVQAEALNFPVTPNMYNINLANGHCQYY
jgi:hypothetical protein